MSYITGNASDDLFVYILVNSRTIVDIRHGGQYKTSKLVAFYVKLNYYAPKMTGFTYQGTTVLGYYCYFGM